MNYRQKYLSVCVAALVGGTAPAWAQVAPNLGAASSFGALGGAGVTCTSPMPVLPAVTVAGNVGSLLAAPSSVTGFPPDSPPLCSLSGTVQLGATTAYANFLTAYNTIDTANPCPSDAAHNLVGDLGGKTLSPGVYCIGGVGLLTGTLTLAGPANGVWIFKGTSITPINGSVVMANGGNACNVYWRLDTTAVFDGNSDFVGNVLAGTGISFTGVGASLAGRALAKTAVTMTGANITACNGGTTQPPSPPPSCDKHHKHDKHCKHDKDDCDRDDGDHGDNNHHGDKDHRGDNDNDRRHDKDNNHKECNQGVGNGPEGCDPGNSNQGNPFWSNDERGGKPGDPGRKGGNKK